MSNDNINVSTSSYNRDTEEPCAKKSAIEQTSSEANINELTNGPNLVSAGTERSLTRDYGQSRPKQKKARNDVEYTSNSFIGPLLPQGIVERKAVIENELDKFYQELEQIAPKEVDTLDDHNTDISAFSQKQLFPALQQEVQPDFSKPVPGPHSGQLLQNKPQNPAHLQSHYQYWETSCLPLSQHSENNPYCGYGTQTRYQRLLYRSPSPFLPQPPPRVVLYPRSDDGPRHSFSNQSQETFQWENMPIKSRHMNQGDLHYAYQNHYKIIPNEFGCNESLHGQPHCSLPQGQSSSFCRKISEESKICQQAYTLPSQSVDPYSLKLILMRGAPGSGKSTLARELLSSCPHGLILSTDDYFFQEDHYVYDPRLLGDAHHWNQIRTQEALQEYHSPIIIDNTNMQAWEMKPYVQMAVESGYTVSFCEPNTSWKYDPSELERRNKHGVPRQKIAKMLERFEQPITVDIVLNSQEPPRHCTEHAFKQQMKRRRDPNWEQFEQTNLDVHG